MILTEEQKFRQWLNKTYGVQDYEAYRNTQTEEIAIQYAALCLEELGKENEDLKNQIKKKGIELSNYAYQIDLAKRDRDKAENKVSEQAEEIKRLSADNTKFRDDNVSAYLKIIELESELVKTKEEAQLFLRWVFNIADRIWVEHTLGWRDNAIEEMYEAYNRSKTGAPVEQTKKTEEPRGCIIVCPKCGKYTESKLDSDLTCECGNILVEDRRTSKADFENQPEETKPDDKDKNLKGL